jgi:hypothetical protein
MIGANRSVPFRRKSTDMKSRKFSQKLVFVSQYLTKLSAIRERALDNIS